MSSADAFWLNFWEIFATIGLILVIVGCVIEGVEHFVKFKKAETKKKHLVEKIGWLILIGGLAMEFLGDKKAKRIVDRENARLNHEAGYARKESGEAIKKAGEAREQTAKFEIAAKELEKQVIETKIQLANANERTALTESNNIILKKEVAQLEIQLVQTGSNVSKIDPLNLPIVWATAEVSFLLPETNSLQGWHFPKSEVESKLTKIFVRFEFKDPDMGDYPVELDCESIDITPGVPVLHGYFVKLSFKSNTLGAEWRLNGLAEKWRNFSAMKFDEIKDAEISMPGLSDKSEIRWGVCWVTLNSTIERDFSIDSPSSKDKIFLHPLHKNSDAPTK